MKHNINAGFTLMETLIVIFISGLIMVGTTLILKNVLVTSRQQNLGMTSIDYARVVSNTFVNEMRNSSYGANGAYPINQAGDTQIIFFSTAPKGDGTVSRVRYYISGNTLYKGIINPSGNPLNYTGTETVTTLLTNLSMGSNPLFYYYDGNYAGTGNALTQQVNINSVKFVKMNLMVLKQETTSSTAVFTITSGASVRNLKTNLGN